MTQEALKLVMDALDDLLYWDNGKPEYDEARKALQVGKQALAQTQEPVAWTLADKVRQDLDRQSCPDAFMRIAVESIVKHHPPQRTEQEPVAIDVKTRDVLHKALMRSGKVITPPQRTEQEPVAWMDADGNVSDNNDHKCFPIPLYTHPPQRTWVGLTDEERKDIELGIEVFDMSVEDVLKEAEAKLKQKNGYAEEKNNGV